MIWNILYIFAGIVLIVLGLMTVDILADITEEDHERYNDYDN